MTRGKWKKGNYFWFFCCWSSPLWWLWSWVLRSSAGPSPLASWWRGVYRQPNVGPFRDFLSCTEPPCLRSHPSHGGPPPVTDQGAGIKVQTLWPYLEEFWWPILGQKLPAESAEVVMRPTSKVSFPVANLAFFLPPTGADPKSILTNVLHS